MPNELARKNPAEIIETSVPDYIERGSQGTEDMGREDITMPRIAIAQANSPQAKKLDPGYIDGLVEGKIFNTISETIYGDELIGIPLFFFKQRMYFGEYGKGEGILCQSLNGKDGGRLHPSDCASCPHAQFKSKDETPDGDTRPDCDQLYNYAMLLSDRTTAVLSLRSTNIKEAKQFNSTVRMSRLPMYAKFLKLTTVGKSQKGNSFYGAVIEWKDFVSKQVYDAARAMFDELRKRDIKVDTRGMEHDEDTAFNSNQM